jgi:very-short-patch-repair endonuclease
LLKRRGPEHQQLSDALAIPEEQTDVRMTLNGNPVFVDILLPEKMLVVEVDGPTHAARKQRIKDKERDRLLNGLGYSVLRVWRWEIEEELQDVVAKITSFTTLKSPITTTFSRMVS